MIHIQREQAPTSITIPFQQTLTLIMIPFQQIDETIHIMYTYIPCKNNQASSVEKTLCQSYAFAEQLKWYRHLSSIIWPSKEHLAMHCEWRRKGKKKRKKTSGSFSTSLWTLRCLSTICCGGLLKLDTTQISYFGKAPILFHTLCRMGSPGFQRKKTSETRL